MLPRLIVLLLSVLCCSHWSAMASAAEVDAATESESAAALATSARVSATADPAVPAGVSNLPALRYPTLGRLYSKSNPACVWYASRVCTNVVWATPNTAEIQSPTLERELKQRIITKQKFTGSRICQRSVLNNTAGAELRQALSSGSAEMRRARCTVVELLQAARFAALFLLLKRNDGAAHAQPQPMPMQMQMPPAWMMQPPQPPPQMQQQSVPSAELRAMQDTLKMLVEAQARTAQTQQQQQRSYGSSSSSSSAASLANNRMRTSSDDDDSGAPTPDLAARLNRTPSSSAAAATAVPAVPFELLQDMKALQDSIKNLERKNRELNRQLTLTEVSNVVDVERKYRLPIPVLNPDSGASAVQGIQQLNLSASEIETIRAIFNMFDVHQTGQISTKELSALHKQLGEPLTDDEANAAVSELDQEGTGSVNFNKFLIWWYHQHTDGKKGSAYTQRFKLMHAKLTTSEFNVDKVITQDSGEVYTLEYRLNFYYKSNAQSLRPISPWHDIPLNRLGTGEQGQLFNFVCEIPKWTRAKFECATGELYNPIKQDTQHGKLRYYKHGDMMFNYGFFPQTWEDPDVIPPDTKCPGDNDPIDCETDWKIIAVSISDPMAHLLNDVDDVELHLPGAIKAIREYFRDYKSYSGKINTYALRAQAMPRHYAIKVLEETHQHWKSLHLVKKRDTIGESSAQAELRMRAVAGSPASSHAMPAAVPIPPHAQSLLQSAGSPIMRGNSMPASVSSPRINGVVQPVGSLTGMDQPLDKLMAGK